jgi:hypothetical protein
MSRQNGRRADALRRLSARYGVKGDDATLAGAALDAVYGKVRERGGGLSEDAAFAEVEAETERIRRERREGVRPGSRK